MQQEQRFLPDVKLQHRQLVQQLNGIFNALRFLCPTLNPKLGQVEPPETQRQPGALAWADGVNWNPGSGEGLYRYTKAGTWVLVG